MCIFKQLRGFQLFLAFLRWVMVIARKSPSRLPELTDPHGSYAFDPQAFGCSGGIRRLSRSMRLSLNSLGYPKIADLGCFRMIINWDFGGRVSDKAYYMILELVLLAISGGYLTHILSFLKQMTRSCLGRLKSRCYLWDLRRRFYLIMQGGIFNGKAVPFERGEWMRMPAVILEQ